MFDASGQVSVDAINSAVSEATGISLAAGPAPAPPRASTNSTAKSFPLADGGFPAAPPGPRPGWRPTAWGPIEVPSDRYWGAQTQRSLHHFPYGQPMPLGIVHAFGQLKAACAEVNGARCSCSARNG